MLEYNNQSKIIIIIYKETGIEYNIKYFRSHCLSFDKVLND